MSKILGILGLMLALAVPAAAQVYPVEVIGECPSFNSAEGVYMAPWLIEAPISVPIDSDIGYPGVVEVDGNALLVDLGALTTNDGLIVGPPLNWYSGGRTFVLDNENCHYRIEWIQDGQIKYELWLLGPGGWEWHSGDWAVGHGNSIDFGVWHVLFTDQPEALKTMIMENNLE